LEHIIFRSGTRKKKARILLLLFEVYGDPLVHPQTEEYYGNVNTIGPRGVYDDKRFQESITMAYHTFHGVETRIVRILILVLECDSMMEE
jgi:dTDP-glucose 4,6-dehydratase